MSSQGGDAMRLSLIEYVEMLFCSDLKLSYIVMEIGDVVYNYDVPANEVA